MDARKYILILALVIVAGFMVAAFFGIEPTSSQNLSIEGGTLSDTGEQAFQASEVETDAQEQERSHQARLRELEYRAAMEQFKRQQQFEEKAHQQALKYQEARHAADIAYLLARRGREMAQHQRQANLETIWQIALTTTTSVGVLAISWALVSLINRHNKIMQPQINKTLLRRMMKDPEFKRLVQQQAEAEITWRNELRHRQEILAQEKVEQEWLGKNPTKAIHVTSLNSVSPNGHSRSYQDLPRAE